MYGGHDEGMTETRTRRPLVHDAATGALGPMTDAELAAAGWVRLPNGNYRKEA
jgi:hypothetical protein